jgi:hypothetical protein
MIESDLNVPDRFEGLREAGTGLLRTIVVPVHDALDAIDARFMDMRAARRGSLLILRGESGAGKSTFLDTIGLFRTGVVSHPISASVDIPATLRELEATTVPRVVVLEGREALRDVSAANMESAMHAINGFVRSMAGRDTLVVWPANTDELTKMLTEFAQTLGGESLLGVDEPFFRFLGPRKDAFVGIAERTIAALNEGASLATLGIASDRAIELSEQASTIGGYLALIRKDLIKNTGRVRRLLQAEQFRLWAVVVAGNEPEGDVAALTRGGFAYADIDRLMASTGANVVADLKNYPDQLGILATVLDARIIYIDMLSALAVARQYGDQPLHALMKNLNMSTSADKKASSRLSSSELGILLAGGGLGTRRVGGKAGDNTQSAFANLAQIARDNDGLLNKAFGGGLKEIGVISEFDTERTLGTTLKFASDLYCVPEHGGPIRIEFMWRTKAGRADIANYVLTKLGNYGKAIGLLANEKVPDAVK